MDEPREVRRGGVLAAAMITAFVTPFMTSSLNLSIPELEQYFNVNATTVNWIVNSYTLAVAAMSLPFGKIADVAGRRKVFIGGIAGFGVFTVLCIFSRTIWMMVAMRAAQGCCAAMMFATNNAILISAYPHSMQGNVLGKSIAATYVGLSAGPVLGGVLNETLGWKSIFIILAVVTAAALAVSIKYVPHDEPLTGGRESRFTDVRGTVLYVAAIVLSLYGMTDLSVSRRARFIFAAGVALIVVFFAAEAHTEDPVIKVSMFTGSRTFTFSNLAALMNYAATFAISYELSIYFQMVRGYSSGRSGLLLVAMPVMQAAFSPMMGSLSDRVRPSALASGGMACCAAGLIMLTFTDADTSIAYIMAALMIAGFGFAMFSSPNNNAIMDSVRPEDYGVANSVIATMRTYGQSAGMAVLNIVTGVVLGSMTLEEAPAADITVMMRTAFRIFAVVCIVGIFFSLMRNKGAGDEDR